MNAVPPAQTIAWKKTIVAIVLVELALIGIYFDTARTMVDIWIRAETYSHAFLVPLIVFWLIWERRHALAREFPRPTIWFTLLIALLAFGWLLGQLAAVNIIPQFAFTAMLVLAVPLVIGLSATRQIVFPLAFLFFAVPFGDFLLPTMMEWTANFIVLGLRASGVPVYQEGLHFVIPSGRWSVIDACSGVRYLIASITVGTIFAYLNYQSLKRRLIFVCFSIVVPLIANWIRGYLIVMLGHYSGNQIAVGADHLLYGWVFFGIVIMIMFAIGMRWREHEVATPAANCSGDISIEVNRSGVGLVVASILALGIAFTPRVVLRVLEPGPLASPPLLFVQDLAHGGWEILEDKFVDWQPALQNPTSTLNAVLVKDGQRVGVFIAWYRQQNADSKLISSDNKLVKDFDKNWIQIGSHIRKASIAGQQIVVRGGDIRNQLTSLGGDPLRLLVWHWYWIDGRMTTSDLQGKLWLAISRLTGHSDNSAAVYVYSPEPQAEAALADYLVTAGAGITSLLEQTAAERR
jgi:exosortase A